MPVGDVHALGRCCWCGAAFVVGTVVGSEFWLCPTEGCWQRQVKYAMVTTVRGRPRNDAPGGNRGCRFVPVPRQVDAFEAVDGPARYVLFGGARGGSKSRAMREIAHRRALTVAGSRMLLLRRTFRELEDNHFEKMLAEAPTMGADFPPSTKLVTYPNGSTLRFGHCETRADVEHYLSSEYDLIFFDELVTFEEQQFQLISSSARTTKPGLLAKVVAGTNPGGPQSHWVQSRFIEKDVDRERYPDYDPAEWVFIPSLLEDNPYLGKDYERQLLDLPPEIREAYRHGRWDVFPGQYYPEFKARTHVTPLHIEYPVEWPRVLSMDWGFVKPGVVGWWVLTPEGKAYREDEYVFTRTVAADVGQEIGRRCKARGLRSLRYLVFDTAMEIPQHDSGEPTIETVRRGMRKAGVSIGTKQADKDRINGWQRLRHWFRLAPDGEPWMMSSPNCRYFNRTIPALVSDDTHPEDVDTDGEDHAADEARYFAMSRPSPGSTGGAVQPRAGTLGAMKQVWDRAQAVTGVLARRGA